MNTPSDVVLCTIGNVVHDRTSTESQDLQTYASIARSLRRIYLIVLSSDDRPFVKRRGRVVMIGLAQRRGAVSARIAFLIGASRVGSRLGRKAGVRLYAASDPLLSGLVGLYLRATRRTPLLVHLQGQLLDMPSEGIGRIRRALMVRLARSVCRRADVVRCVSRELHDSAIAAGVRPSRIVYLPSRVDTSAFSPEEARRSRSEARRQLNVEGSEVILFVGTLSPFKGVDHLLRALPSILEVRPRARVVLVGSGPMETTLKLLVQSLGLEGEVEFAGRRPHEQMPRLLSAADVLVLPSMNEGLPRVILEAMASGLPVVASKVGGIPEVVEDGRTGFLVPPGDPPSLVAALCKVLADPVLRTTLGDAGRNVVTQHYERESNIGRYVQMVNSVTGADQELEAP